MDNIRTRRLLQQARDLVQNHQNDTEDKSYETDKPVPMLSKDEMIWVVDQFNANGDNPNWKLEFLQVPTGECDHCPDCGGPKGTLYTTFRYQNNKDH